MTKAEITARVVKEMEDHPFEKGPDTDAKPLDDANHPMLMMILKRLIYKRDDEHGDTRI